MERQRHGAFGLRAGIAARGKCGKLVQDLAVRLSQVRGCIAAIGRRGSGRNRDQGIFDPLDISHHGLNAFRALPRVGLLQPIEPPPGLVELAQSIGWRGSRRAQPKLL
jgi:hypothetical protein